MNVLWITAGWISVALGVVGIFLPLLPTTPFLLLGAFCFSKGSERLHHWLMTHPKLGPPIHNWQHNRAISRRIKWLATASIAAVFGVSVWLQIPPWVLATQGAVLTMVCLFIWTRNEHAAKAGAKTYD